jgi:hypothetical protein
VVGGAGGAYEFGEAADREVQKRSAAGPCSGRNSGSGEGFPLFLML